MNKNKLNRSLAAVIAVLMASTTIAHENERNTNSTIDKSSGYSKIKIMAKSMGGLENILALQGVEYVANGTRFLPEQSFKPSGEFMDIGDYNYKFTNVFNKQQTRTEWILDIRFPFIEQRTFTEVINGNHGAVYGFDTIIAPPQAPMQSTRLGARVKQNLVSSPLALIHRASLYPDQVQFLGTTEFNGRVQQIVSIPGWDQTIRMFIDAKTKLPTKAETLEDDTVYGDALWEVSYEAWNQVSGIKIPTSLKHEVNGRNINNEYRSSINLTTTIDASQFAIPAELITDFNADQYAWGIRASQWFNGLLNLAIPFDLDQRSAATLQFVEIAPKVFHAKSFTHHSMIIEMQDYLIVTEAPLYEERSQAVISEIKKRWPSKPVKYLVVTHFHRDHIGGIRAYGELGATIIVGDQTKDHYEAIFKAQHTVHPDAYQNNPVDVTIVSVEASDDLVLTDGIRNVRIFDIANRHATGSLAPFIEDANLLFVSDLYSPEFFAGNIPRRFLGWSEDLLTALRPSPLDIQWIVGGHGGVTSYDTFVTQVESSL